MRNYIGGCICVRIIDTLVVETISVSSVYGNRLMFVYNI